MLASCASTSKSPYASEPQETYNGLITNDYSAANTKALAKEFPVMNSTSFDNQMEKDIQNRLLTGFANWNRGFDAWKAWGNILYVPESIYNVHGARLTLKEYQDAMDITLKQTNIPEGVEIFEGNLCSLDDCMDFFEVGKGTQTICIHCASLVTVHCPLPWEYSVPGS